MQLIRMSRSVFETGCMQNSPLISGKNPLNILGIKSGFELRIRIDARSIITTEPNSHFIPWSGRKKRFSEKDNGSSLQGGAKVVIVSTQSKKQRSVVMSGIASLAAEFIRVFCQPKHRSTNLPNQICGPSNFLGLQQ